MPKIPAALFHTVGDLRVLLQGVPDNARLTISSLPRRLKRDGHDVLTSVDGGELTEGMVRPENSHLVTDVCICEVNVMRPGTSVSK